MKQLIQTIRAERIKLRHTCFLPVHVCVPLGVVALFLLYYSFSCWDAGIKIKGFYEVLGMGFPILIGLLTALMGEQELNAGKYQMVLSAPNCLKVFYSKLYLLIRSGCLAILATSILFGLGNRILLHQRQLDMKFYLLAAFALIGESIILYTFHLFLAMRLNKGITILIGIAEGLISALMITGLGDSNWCYLPCSWASRWISNLVNHGMEYQPMEWRCKVALYCCIIMSCITLLLFHIWSLRWEGVHTEE